MVDLAKIEDENEKAKALKRRIKEDRKKAQKVREAEQRAEQKELEKQQKAKEKSAKKGKKKVTTLGQEDMESPTINSAPQERTGSRSRKRRTTYDELNQLLKFNGAEDCGKNEEMILNSSLDDVRAGKDDDCTPTYLVIKNFLLKVKQLTSL